MSHPTHATGAAAVSLSSFLQAWGVVEGRALAEFMEQGCGEDDDPPDEERDRKGDIPSIDKNKRWPVLALPPSVLWNRELLANDWPWRMDDGPCTFAKNE